MLASSQTLMWPMAHPMTHLYPPRTHAAPTPASRAGKRGRRRMRRTGGRPGSTGTAGSITDATGEGVASLGERSLRASTSAS